MKYLFGKSLLITFIVIFSICTISGILLVCYGNIDREAPPEETKVGVDISKDKVRFDITTSIPGLIIFVFGAIGLICMVIRVPIYQITTPRYLCDINSRIPFETMTVQTPDINLHTPKVNLELPNMMDSRSEQIQIPLLFWLLIKIKRIFSKGLILE